MLLLSISLCAIWPLSSTVYAKDKMVVDVIKPVLSANSQVLTISGTLTADKQSLLSPSVDGLIESINVDAGSKVKKGDVLLKLDSTMSLYVLQQLKANVVKARVDRDEAQRLVQEAEKLVARKHIPENELAIRKANLALKNAELLSIKASQATEEENLRRHDLIAPFSGVISSKRSEAGEWVSRGDAVLELVSLDKVRLDLNIPQEHFADIKAAQEVTVISDTYPNQSLKGKVQAIVPVSNTQVRTFLVRVSLDNTSLPLMPGTSATAEIAVQLGNRANLLIPRDALLHDPDGSYSVFIVRDDKALRRKVTIDRTNEAGVTIANGLDINDLVVIRGNEVLQNQQVVTINQIRD